MEQAFVNTVLPKLGLRHVMDMRNPPLWISYDREGDAVRVVFEEAKKSDKSALDKNDVIVTKRGKKLINMTILNASRLFS
ncbi:MAG: Uncharacterized protein G01um10145_775 [Microgenomates group bacterium Gr01-1014_5]|nr:MAG: Uncharacterized protein G01um10145_775 [Microgenomates group bacterium Gr01-1014_5]